MTTLTTMTLVLAERMNLTLHEATVLPVALERAAKMVEMDVTNFAVETLDRPALTEYVAEVVRVVAADTPVTFVPVKAAPADETAWDAEFAFAG
jgi:hypothetical protein